MSLWIGFATIAIGLTLVVTSRLEREAVPAWLPRLAVAVTSLGAGTLASTRPGVGWSFASIGFSLVAIVLLLLVIRDTLRR
jgi:hypothetical protein